MFCTTECWSCEDKACEHYIDKTKLYFENEKNKEEIERLNNIIDEIHLLFIEFDRNVMKRKYVEANMINLKIKAKLKELKEGK